MKHGGLNRIETRSIGPWPMILPRELKGAARVASVVNDFRKKSFWSSSILDWTCFFFLDNKTIHPASPDSWTVHITSQSSFEADVATVFSLFLLFLFWLDLWKITVNHKNMIKWKIQFFELHIKVDIHNKYIVWYTLVQIFCCSFRYILFCN